MDERRIRQLDADPAGLVGIEWQLASLRDHGKRWGGLAEYDAVLRFDGRGHVSGNDGCNFFGRAVEIRDGELDVGGGMQTLMGCLGPRYELSKVVGTALREGTVSWFVQQEHLYLGEREAVRLVYRVRPSIYPSDQAGSGLLTIIAGQHGTGDYRLTYRAGGGSVALDFESRDAPGAGWGFAGMQEESTWHGPEPNPMLCMHSNVGTDRFVFGLITSAVDRIVFRRPDTGDEVELPIHPLEDAGNFSAYGDFVGDPPRGSTVSAYDRDGHLLGPPHAPWWWVEGDPI